MDDPKLAEKRALLDVLENYLAAVMEIGRVVQHEREVTLDMLRGERDDAIEKLEKLVTSDRVVDRLDDALSSLRTLVEKTHDG